MPFLPHRSPLGVFVLGLLISISSSTGAAEKATPTPGTDPILIIETINKAIADDDFSKKGADSCLKCHDQTSSRDTTGIFRTLHGRSDTAFDPLQCETCHGPGKDHSKNRLRKGETRAPVIAYGLDSAVTPEQQNQMCLSCHEKDQGRHWAGTAHESADIPCASCHRIHDAEDRAQEKEQQNTVCSSCHQQVANELQLRSSHPLRYGQMSCSDCHSTHENLSDASLKRNTLNNTCFDCHADKRGPYLWEHAPAAEDCSQCHSPHGSINASLLKTRTPQLCQQCHSEAQHPSFGYQGLGTTRPSGFVAGESCLNCHQQVHGSNHPSGNLLQR